MTLPGIYWVTVINKNCLAKDTLKVDYLNKPSFTLGNDTAICQGMSIVLYPKIVKGTGLSYLWNDGSTTSSIVVNQQGNFSVTLSNQCGTKTNDINIVKGICQLYVPNSFTPNGDGVNDILKALYGENITDFNFQIYNRYGEMVFISKNITSGWDGKYKGSLQNNGV